VGIQGLLVRPLRWLGHLGKPEQRQKTRKWPDTTVKVTFRRDGELAIPIAVTVVFAEKTKERRRRLSAAGNGAERAEVNAELGKV
jgi:hypothetical protein